LANTRAKVGDYPFTTLRPQLGVVRHRMREFVLADIPGLIEGASEGIGIGDRFLGHNERCGVLIHQIDATSEDVAHVYKAVRYELGAYADVLAEKPEIVVLNKIDALTPDEIKDKTKILKRVSKAEVMTCSGVTGQGVQQVLYRVISVLDAEKAERAEVARRAIEPGWSP
jgi:GTP-binding protein